MKHTSTKGRPQAAATNLGHGLNKGVFTPLSNSIVPQVGASCQERMISEKWQLLADIVRVLEKFNRAKAAYLVSGDAGDFLAAQALADDRAVLLQEIGGESWP